MNVRVLSSMKMNPCPLHPFLVLIFLSLAIRPAQAEADVAQAPQPPNIVFILADDMGWNQVGYHGSIWYETPNIDQLARDGMQFSDAYSAAPICSPTRAALMTGRAPARLHLTDYIPGRKWTDKPLDIPKMRQGLPLEETTLPEILHQRGYISGIFGKWHLAPSYDYDPERPMDPESQGFDVVFHTQKPKAKNPPLHDKHNAITITDHAIKFIEQNRGRPFFCYIAHNVVHTPLMEEPEAIEKYQQKMGADQPVNNAIMGAMIETMDRQIGRLLTKLDELNLLENTIVVFTSDNGNIMAEHSQAPFRGGKATIWEGGIRVPLAVRWPGVTRPGTTSSEPVITQDWFPTLVEAAGATVAPAAHDGVGLRPILSGKTTTLRREALYWHYPHYHSLGDWRPGGAIRMSHYKLIEWYEGSLLGHEPMVSLFDLENDPGENHDLADKQSERAGFMREKLRVWRKQVGAQEMTVPGMPTGQVD